MLFLALFALFTFLFNNLQPLSGTSRMLDDKMEVLVVRCDHLQSSVRSLQVSRAEPCPGLCGTSAVQTSGSRETAATLHCLRCRVVYVSTLRYRVSHKYLDLTAVLCAVLVLLLLDSCEMFPSCKHYLQKWK